MTEAVALLAWLSCLEESHISFLFNHQLSLSVIGEPVIFCVWAWCPLLVLAAWQTLRALLALPSLGNASLARPQLGHTFQGWPPHGGVGCTCSSPLVCLFSVWKSTTPQHRFFCPPVSMSSCWKPAFWRNSFIYLRCAVSIGCTCS